MTCRGQILTMLAQDVKGVQAKLVTAMVEQIPVGSSVVVVDGLGRRMPCSVLSHGTGSNSGYLNVLPVNSKSRRRSVRSVHWSQLDLENGDD